MLTTRRKIALARMVQAPLLALLGVFGKGPMTSVVRGGVRWRLDLREGIDFSIFLLGGFEPGTIAAYGKIIRPGMVVLDIGANIGAHTLNFARLVGPSGRVIAFEPSAWAHGRLRENIALNPELAARIETPQVLLTESADEAVPEALHASWPMAASDDVHPKLCGRLMSTEGARAAAGDDILAAMDVGRVDFIKLDVDGYEGRVLAGLRRTLVEHGPVILMELSPYILRERGDSAERMLTILQDAGYRLTTLGGRDLPDDPAAAAATVADGASINVTATRRPSQGG